MIEVIYGILIGLVLGMAIHREGCLWAREIAQRDAKRRAHRQRVQDWERRRAEGEVEAWIR